MADFQIQPDGHGMILSGELDMSSAPAVAAAFADVVGHDGPVTVDMRRLQFMDSSGIQAIIAAANTTPDCIILHGVRDEVQRVVEITGIERIANLHVMPCEIGPALTENAGGS